jgi:hypothetical protein
LFPLTYRPIAIVSRTPCLERPMPHFVSTDIPAYCYCLKSSLFGEADASFLHQLKTLRSYSSSWKGRAVGRPNVWIFTPLNPFTYLNYVALGTL